MSSGEHSCGTDDNKRVNKIKQKRPLFLYCFGLKLKCLKLSNPKVAQPS